MSNIIRELFPDGPLVFDMTLDPKIAGECLAAYVPTGSHSHDRTETPYSPRKRKSETEFPRQPGRLKRWLLHTPNWFPHIKTTSAPKPTFKMWISIFLAYARILDVGGVVPATRVQSQMRYTQRTDYWTMRMGPKRGRPRGVIMHWGRGGKDVHTHYRRGYSIEGREYTAYGLQDFLQNKGDQSGVVIGWRPSTSLGL